MSQILFWKEVEIQKVKKWYWSEDTSITLDGSLVQIAGIIYGFILLTVCLAFPSFLVWKIHQLRSKLKERKVLYRYGFFYKAYSTKYRWWRIVVLGRKALLAFFSVVWGAFSDELKEYIALFVLLFALGFQTRFNPHKYPGENWMETGSLMVSSVACVLEGMIRNPDGDKDIKSLLNVLNNVLVGTYTVILLLRYLFLTKYKLQDLYAQYHGDNPPFWLKIACVVIEPCRLLCSLIQQLKRRLQDHYSNIDSSNHGYPPQNRVWENFRFWWLENFVLVFLPNEHLNWWSSGGKIRSWF